RLGVLDRVAAARVQQAVEAPARALGEIGTIDEDDVEAAQGGIPGHAGAGRAATDDEDVGAQRSHTRRLLPPRYLAVAGREDDPCDSYDSESNQSKVRVTAFFQYL